MRRHVTALVGLGGVLSAVGVASAHVKYVTDERGTTDPLQFLIAALTEPLNAALLLGGGLAVVAVVAAYLWFRPLRADLRAARRALRSYRDLLPWMLRLSVGLPLVGAGYNGYFFSPVLQPQGLEVAVRLFGIGIGFLLLFGFATRLVASVGLAGFLFALAAAPAEAMLSFEYLPAFVAIVLLGGGRPSADHVIHRLADDERTVYSTVDPIHRRLVEPFRRLVEPYEPLAPTAVRVGMGVAFVYLGLSEKLLAPAQALAVVEKYHLAALGPFPPELWVIGAGLTEMAVGLALIAGFLTRGVTGVAFLLFTTTLFGLPDDPVLAHVSLFGLASVLLVTGSGPYALDRRLERLRAGQGVDAGTGEIAD
ncbi:MAG: DoxX family protein [Haloferacaceae archaeon]